MYNLSGKVALVTGTSNKRGVGRGIALRLAQDGADLVVVGRGKGAENVDPWDRTEGWQGIESLVAEIQALGRHAIPVWADISNAADIDRLVNESLGRFGKIDILVNNAAWLTKEITAVQAIDLDEQIWNKSLAVNLTGSFLLSKAVARDMIERKIPGRIINISSMVAKAPLVGTTAYAVSKAGLIALTQSLALELASHKILVNAVCPGTVATWWGAKGEQIFEAVKSGLSEKEAITKIYTDTGWIQQIPLGRPAFADDIANMVAFLCSADSDYITGQAINVNGGALMAH